MEQMEGSTAYSEDQTRKKESDGSAHSRQSLTVQIQFGEKNGGQIRPSPVAGLGAGTAEGTVAVKNVKIGRESEGSLPLFRPDLFRTLPALPH